MNLKNRYPLPFLSQSHRARWNLRQIKKKPGTTIQILIKPKGGRDYRMFWWKCRLELLGTYLKGMAWHRSSPGTCRPGRSWTEQLAAGRLVAAAGPAGWSEASLPGCSLMKIIIQITSSNTSQHSFKILKQEDFRLWIGGPGGNFWLKKVGLNSGATVPLRMWLVQKKRSLFSFYENFSGSTVSVHINSSRHFHPLLWIRFTLLPFHFFYMSSFSLLRPHFPSF